VVEIPLHPPHSRLSEVRPKDRAVCGVHDTVQVGVASGSGEGRQRVPLLCARIGLPHQGAPRAPRAVARGQRAEVEAGLLATRYAIHFHAFSRETFAELMEWAAGRFPADPVECRGSSTGDGIEYVAILRRL
jgi:hypothetical protein